MPRNKVPYEFKPKKVASVADKGWSSRSKTYLAIFFGVITLGAAYYAMNRSRDSNDLYGGNDNSLNANPNNKDLCNTDNLLALTYQPGKLILLPTLDPDRSLVYPLVYPHREAQGWTKSAEQKGYLKAVRWLKTQPPLKDLSDTEFTKILKTSHAKMLPESEHGYRTTFVYLSKDENLELFDDNIDLNNVLTREEFDTLKNIREKVKNVINHYIDTNSDSYRSSNIFHLRETIAMDLAHKGFLQQGEEKEMPRKQYLFNPQEKKFIKKWFSFKPECSNEIMDARLHTGFLKIIESHKHNPAKLAAHLHMLIVDIHPFPNGNGRIARAVLNSVRISVGLPIIVFPNRQHYMEKVYQSVVENNYEIFEKYINDLMPEKGAREIEEICNYLNKNDCGKPNDENYFRCLTYLEGKYKKKEALEKLVAPKEQHPKADNGRQLHKMK